MSVLSLFLSLLLSFSAAHAERSSSGGGGMHYGITLTPNIPHVYNLAYESVNRASLLTYSLNVGVIPPLGINIASVNTFNFDARIRCHPFGGAFFFGLGLGYQKYGGSGSTTLSVSGQSIPLTLNDTLSGGYITPHAGFLWFFGRLILGLELGAQTGIGSSNKLAITLTDPTQQSFLTQIKSDPNYQTFEKKINDAIKTLSDLPYVGIKIGWIF